MYLKPLLKPSILLAFFSIFNFGLFAQNNDECGFIYSQESQRYYDTIKEDLKLLEKQFLQDRLSGRNSTVLSSVPVKAHIIRTSIGTGGLTVAQLNDALLTMNEIYVGAGLEFFLCDGINYINSDDYYDYETEEEDALTAANNVNGVINIYFTDSVTSSSSGGGLCGYAYFPGGPETILMANGCATNGSTLAHEMGHFFALSHTHGNSNVFNSTEELVGGSNCESTGDFICDTPADPKLGNNNVNPLCEYFDFATDDNGQAFEPQTENLMSYSRKVCRSVFTPEQYARINSIYQISRSNLECPSFNIDFTADATESCEANLTVNFTDSSFGATSWAWDVNGDDIIDYTTQNVTHTYDTGGKYDVALTVTDGAESISKLKTEYINVGAQETTTSTIQLNLTLDDWPNETTWQFLDANDNVLYSGGPYINGVDDFTVKTATFEISPNACYSFEISDSYGDGICCLSGNGFYELLADDLSVLTTGGDYNDGTTNNFYSGTLSVDEFSTEEITLYPNPTNGSFTITSNTIPDAYSIYNTLGQVVKQSKVSVNADLQINVEALNNGVYFIKLTKGESTKVLSFIKN